MRILKMSDLDLREKRVLMRVDFNVPIRDGKISDDARIRACLPGIRRALESRARLMLVSHFGRPKEGEFDEAQSLAPAAAHLSALLGRDVPLKRSWLQGVSVGPGSAVLLENCRFNKGERNNDDALARKIAAMCDVYVNDAFGAAHRAEATTLGVARYAPIACAGPLMAAEIEALSRALENPVRPLVAIVAGAKVSTKLPILRHLARKVDQLVVGGAIANTFMLAFGGRIGKSLAEREMAGEARKVVEECEARGGGVPMPIDVVCAKELSQSAKAEIKPAELVAEDDMILDIGRQSARALQQIVKNAGTVVWNGPVGAFEYEQFAQGTKMLAEALAETRAFTLAGGGETLAAIAKFGVGERISYMSTGGGAFLEFLEGKKLPAIEALEQRASGLLPK